MTTFVLKKYREQFPEETANEPKEEKQPEEKPEETISLSVDSSVAEVVARALNRVLVNKSISVTEQDDEPEEGTTIKAISTEYISEHPLAALQTAKSSSCLLVTGGPFKGRQGDWFMTNMTEHTGKVFYSVESFVEHVVREFSK